MKKYQLLASILVLLIAVIGFTEIAQAKKKHKKRKKHRTAHVQSKQSPVSGKDSLTLIHEPGVRNKKQLDSIKAIKNKQKLESQKK